MVNKRIDNNQKPSYKMRNVSIILLLCAAAVTGACKKNTVVVEEITVSPTAATFAAEGETKTFTVTTTGFAGTVTVTQTDGTSSWLTASLGGSTLTVAAAATDATVTTARTATITLTAGTATATVSVTQEKYVSPAPDGSAATLAAPGVIGYIKGTNTLTLKGSKEYAVNPDIKKYADDNFGGLSDQTVYAAYFKFGSLVAVSSDPTDSSSPCLEPEDIVAAPVEWQGSLGAARDYIGTDWNKIPLSAALAAGGIIVIDPSAGLGDPCAYYTRYFGEGWKLPTGTPYNGAPDYSKSNLTWKGADGVGAGLPAGELSGRDGESGVFYPAAGYRNHSNGAVGSQGSGGRYWSSVAIDGTTGSYLYFIDTYINASNASDYTNGFNVRCVSGN
jgi:hypothetical protein